ncbi:hypothetical protein ACSBR2_011781 [Camellia fascicularis]
MGSSLYLYSLLLLCCFFHLIILSNSSSSPPPLCHEDESSALLQFKHSFFIDEFASDDPSAHPKVESWRLEGKSSDCCSWDGVECDHHTGHVIGLDLSSSLLYGSINSNSSLFNLVHLRRINLADNDFNYSQIPSKIAHLSRLRSLNLSQSLFYGQIPLEISNLSKLVFLDLSVGPNFRDLLNLEKSNLGDLLKNLTNLKVVDLSWVNISSTITSDLSNMSSLTTLRLRGCRLYGKFPTSIFRLPNLQFLNVEDNENLTGCLPEFHHTSPLKALEIARTNFFGMLPDSIGNLESLSILALNECNFSGMLPASLGNLAQLTILHLGTNHFWGKIPSSLSNLTQLTYLHLGKNNFDVGALSLILGKLSKLSVIDLEGTKIHGDIPQSLANMTQLSYLSLRSNELLGQIPSWLMNATQLISLDLSRNQLQGTIPSSISQLEHLEYFNFADNNLIGKVKIDIFLKLLNLNTFYLSRNKLTVLSKNSTNTTLPKIIALGLSSCNLREFPDFLRFQDELRIVFLGDNNIHGQIPTWFCNTSKETMEVLTLPHNFLTGFEQHLDVIPWQSLKVLDLSFNRMQGSLPIPSPSLIYYGFTGNLLTGEIPPSFCQHNSTRILDLSNNNLSGTIPQCLANFSDSLLVLNLSYNNFHGTIPQIFMNGNQLKLIDLSQNQLRGQVPRSLENCTMLEVLVIGNNQIEDTFPFWLGALPQLKVLVLRSNSFHGAIGNQKTNLMFPMLRIIDLSHNDFSGNLPSDYFHNWNAMKMAKTETWTYIQETSVSIIAGTWTYPLDYNYSVTLANKGTQRLYEHIQTAFVALDLSNNKFKGDIPESLGSLSGLQVLNISNNNLTGVIPSSLANLTELESLDLSQNQLSGEIPQQLAQLTFLEFLNVSHNHLTGPIPHGNQFDTFDNSSYYENSGLCGNPLSKLCGNSRSSLPPPSLSFQSDDSKFPSGVDWIVIFMGFGSGLIVGLVMGNALTTRYHEWFVMTFGKGNQTQRRKKGRRN